MALVEFEDENSQNFHIRSPKISFFGAPETPTMIKVLLKLHIAKNEKQALIILIGVIIVATLGIVGIWYFQNHTPTIIRDQYGREISLQQYIQEVQENKL